MTTQRATKTQITRIADETCPEGKWYVAAQGTTEIVRYTARQRMGMAIEKRSTTKMQQNGRYRVTVWGKNPQDRTQRIADALAANGYTIENATIDSFEVHNGTILPLDGILRWQGTY